MYLLRGGQYASCVHAGGLSCNRFKMTCNIVLFLMTQEVMSLAHWQEERLNILPGSGTDEYRGARPKRLADTARTSFAKSCDEILDRYGIRVAPRRQDSSSITSSATELSPGANTRQLVNQDSVTTTSSSSLPYMSMNDSTASAANAMDNVYASATTRKQNDVTLDTSIQGNLDGTKSKLVQMSSMKLHESGDTIKDNISESKVSDNSLEIKGDVIA